MRALGLLEKYQVSKLLTHCYGSITLTAVLEHDHVPSGDIRQFYLSWLYPALSRLVAKHPLLTAVVQDADKETAHFTTVSDFYLESIVTFGELEYWQPKKQAERLAEQCDKEFDYNDHSVPLWRLHIDTHPDRPKECSITFAVQHVIADGKSLTIFWQDLLEYLDDGNNETTLSPPYLLQANKEKAIQPAYEHRGAPRLGIMDKVRLIAGHVLPSLFGDNTKVWRGDRPSVMDRAKVRHDTAVQVIRIEPTTWKKICATAKQQGVSPHAAIMTAIMMTFSQLYPEEPAVKSSTPVNCRGLVNPCIPSDEIGNFVGSYSRIWTSSDMKDASFWNAAKAYHQGLQVNKMEAAKQVFQLEFLNRFPEDYCELWYGNWKKYPPMGREGGIELSDLGRCSANARELYFCQTVNTFTLAINVNAISTLDAMQATIAFQKGTLDESKMEQFGTTLMNTLKLSIQE